MRLNLMFPSVLSGTIRFNYIIYKTAYLVLRPNTRRSLSARQAVYKRLVARGENLADISGLLILFRTK